MQQLQTPVDIGIIGCGAFGRLAANSLAAYATVKVWDIAIETLQTSGNSGAFSALQDVAACPIVIIAVPVLEVAGVARKISPYLQPGSVVVDVGSVKLLTAKAMQENLPATVDIVGTHPLFGPQSARDGIRGHKIAVCNVRGRSHLRIAALLRHVLGLRVFLTTPDQHDRELAVVQGLTHLVAGVLNQLEPLPSRLTTMSYDLMMEAISMVRDDPPNVFDAIERQNPYVANVREEFLSVANELHTDLAVKQRKRFELSQGSF